MAHRTLFERDTLTISDWQGADQISRAHSSRLAMVEPSLPKGFVTWTARGVRLGSYCGVLRLGDETIEILPKLFRDGRATEQNRSLLLHLLTFSRSMPWLKNWQGALDQQPQHLLDVFIKKFCSDLRAVLAGGPARSYRERVEEISVIRGRLDITDHSHRPPGTRHRMVCRFDEFDEDIPMNRVLRHCIERISALARTASLRNNLDELRLCFEDVAPIAFRPSMLAAIRLDRSMARFQGVWEQCSWLLRGLFPDAIAGGAPHASLLFDMEALFEEAVFRLMRKELFPLGFDCRFQGPQKYLLNDPQGENPRRRMKPDIMLTLPSGGIVILDCKWKLLDGAGDFVSQLSHADLYQLHTYATEYKAKAVALMYPWMPGLPEKPQKMLFISVGVPVWFVFVKMEVFNSRSGEHLTANWQEVLETEGFLAQ